MRKFSHSHRIFVQSRSVQQLDVRTQRILLPVVGAILCISLGWTLWLIMLTIFPNNTINFVMSTQAFDDGSFWAIIEPPIEVVAVGVTGLAIVMIGHIEGKPGFPGLVALPEDLFDGMERLTFMHLAVLEDLTRLPSFQGLINLRSLTLALLGSLTELPELTHQKTLQTLTLLMAPMVQTLPDLAPVSNTLQQLVILGRGTLCCNGFLDNRCDLSNALCQTDGVLGSPPATCLPVNRSDRLATAATIQMMKKFEASTCIPPSNPPATGTPIIQTYTTEANVLACNGTMYRECSKPTTNQRGICMNALLMPIACNGDDTHIEVRRRQIQQGVGARCNPQYEAWLGCPKR
ncbi:hypothetical protein BBJ28_00018480 [Nothophytophthora sp. Chile5]|nr:hypothetical protein BBJ28_00018480 [Nothophytophthora sp. Chile5]